MEQQAQRKKLLELIEGVKICMLTTESEDGYLRSRPMAILETYPEDEHLWFFTSNTSGKVGEIQQHQIVNLAFSHPSQQRYVSVSGPAEISHDRQKMQELWKPMAKAWFPEGLEDPRLALLKVRIDKAEYWESPSSPVVTLIGLAKATLTGKAYEGGEHGTVDLRQ